MNEQDACERWASIADQRLIGEEISDADARFAEQHAAECELCGAEAGAWQELAADGERPAELEPARARDLVEQALRGGEKPAAQPAPPRSLDAERQKRQVRIGAAVAATLAVAAAAILWLRAPSTTVDAGPRAKLASVRGDVRIDGRPASDGTEVATGAQIETANGRACLTWPGNVRACVDRQTRVTAADLDPAARRIELAHGTVVAALDPLPDGHAFVVSAGEARVQVKGTVFSVTRSTTRPDVIVRVHEGVVAAQAGAQGTPRDVTRDQQLTLSNGMITPMPTGLRRRELELAGIDAKEPARQAEPPAQPPPPADLPPADDAGAKAQKLVDSGASASPAELLKEAQKLRAQGNAAGAAAAYRRLQAQHPRSPEAHASRLSLAELMLGPLGDAAGALAAYDAYLRGGGGLRQEARYGRIMALRRLGRSGEASAAVDAFVRDYPNSVQARALAQRAADAATP